jgi:predicted TIM-barrel fold metal-dependent hydrolase
MFGSNFPVDKLHASYRRVWSAYEEISAGLGVQEQELLFGGTARSFYRL